MKSPFSEILDQTINRRFENGIAQIKEQPKLNNDFYMDLLCVFHAPDQFKATDSMKYPVEVILGYLKQTHEFYLTKNLSEIELAIGTITQRQPGLAPLQELVLSFFTGFKDRLESHILEEEAHLFPYIEALCGTQAKVKLTYNAKNKMKLMDLLLHHSDDLENEIHLFVKKLETIAASYDDNFAFRMMITRLSVFELDLRIHGKIEDEVLMPLALQLENDVLGSDNLQFGA